MNFCINSLKKSAVRIPEQSPAGTADENLQQVTEETSDEIAGQIPEVLGIV